MAAARLKALFLTRYGRDGPSSRVRALTLFPALERRGIDATAEPLLDESYVAARFAGRVPMGSVARSYMKRLRTLARARRFDVVWLEGELFPWLPSPAEWLVRLAGRPLVVDYDDAVFHRYDLHANPLVRALLGGKIDAVMRSAVIVTAGNDYLAGRARKAGARRVEVLPSVVDTGKYPKGDRPAGAPFTLGWIGSPVTAPYLDAIAGPLREAMAQGARLRLVGAGEAALPGFDCERLPWSEATEADLLAGIDVGLMPLRDGPWERGKCGYKLVQCMAAGRPVIASPVGVNAKIVADGVDGFLAASPEDWRRRIAELAADPSRRAEMGRAARAKAEREYSVDAVAPRMAQLLRDAAQA